MKAKTTILACFLAGLMLVSGMGAARGQDATSDLLSNINTLRGSLGLPPYALNAALSVAAQNQAAWMATTGQISHTQPDGSTPRTRAAAAGYPSTFVSENIYMGTSATAASAFQWWLNSPIHYAGITNARYTEIGIGASSGDAGRAFVLVFGNPTGYPVAVASANNASSSSSGAASGPPVQPLYVVGIDSVGNIMHEIQPGDTLGDIALIYGYTWEDIPYMLEVNSLTWDESRVLEVGSVFLVPPQDGTYTPTPGAPAAPTLTEVVSTLLPSGDATQPAQPMTATPSPPPTWTPSTPGVVVTSNVVPEWVIETQLAAASSPTPAATSGPVVGAASTLPAGPSATVPAGQGTWSAATITPTGQEVASIDGLPQSGVIDPVTVEVVQRAESTDEGSDTPPLLIVAVVLQVAILGLAGAEFLRRRKG